MDSITILGLVAGALTTFSTLPEILRTVKMKETRDLSITWVYMLAAGTLLWTIYGYYISSFPIIASNALSFVFACILIWLKLRYK